MKTAAPTLAACALPERCMATLAPFTWIRALHTVGTVGASERSQRTATGGSRWVPDASSLRREHEQSGAVYVLFEREEHARLANASRLPMLRQLQPLIEPRYHVLSATRFRRLWLGRARVARAGGL